MNIYLLKDVSYDDKTSKINNFSRQWLKWYPCANTIFPNVNIKDDDIIIINLYKGTPYGRYKIPENCKKLFIVHGVNEKTVGYIDQDADFVIYLNDLSRQIVEDIVGINKPCLVAPRHPMPVFTTEVKQKKSVYIGGWFTKEKTEGLMEKLLKLHGELPGEYQFTIYPVWGKIIDNLEAVREFTNKLKNNSYEFGERLLYISNDELLYDIMMFKTRISSHSFLWDSGPSIQKVKDLLASKDSNILNYDIEESSMLAICQASQNELIVEDRIKFLPYFEKTEPYTYQQFSQLVKEAISKIK